MFVPHFISFVVCTPLFHVLFAVEQNIFLKKNLIFTNLSQNIGSFPPVLERSASVSFNLPNVTQFTYLYVNTVFYVNTVC